MSIVFDRAVDYYDKTRALPEAHHRALIDSLLAEANVKRSDTVLEIGIGTGRIAMSVAEHVERLFGIDLSQEMMGVLRGKLAAADLHVEMSQADAVRLPFAASTFDVAYAVHVYHLVSQWEDAIGDAFRVVKPGGHFVVSFHRRLGTSPNARLRKQMHAFVHEYGVDTRRPGAQSEEEIYEAILKYDPNPKIALVNAWRDAEVPQTILDDLDKQIFSETWMIPREVMDKTMPRLREWAANEFGDLSQPIETTSESRWLVAKKQ